MIHHRPSGDVTHVSRRSHRRTSCTTVDYQDQVQIICGTRLINNEVPQERLTSAEVRSDLSMITHTSAQGLVQAR